MSTKICTSIEQSKKLLSLGLAPSTADMCYGSISYDSPGPYCEVVKAHKPDLDFNDLPCWSLAALLELIPNDYISLFRDDEGWFMVYDICTTEVYDNPLDAAFEMVVWLIEQEILK